MRKYTLNESFFEVIDTEEKAYWLGFISADGCIGRNRHGNYIYLSIALQRKDRSHLEKWAKAIGYDGPVSDYTGHNANGTINEYSKLVVSSRKLTDDLRKLGVSERKSLILKPANISDHLLRSYLRGLLDGDGTLFIEKNGQPRIRFNGTKEIVECFVEFCRDSTNSKAKMFPFKSIHSYVLGGTRIVGRVVDLLYGDARVALTRKHDIARVIIGKFACVEGVT